MKGRVCMKTTDQVKTKKIHLGINNIQTGPQKSSQSSLSNFQLLCKSSGIRKIKAKPVKSKFPKKPGRKIQDRTIRTKDRIKNAAKKLFVRDGFDGTSVGSIAELAEVNQSLVHHHFGAKQDLWNLIRDEIYGAYISATLSVLGEVDNASARTTAASQIERLLAARFEFLEKNPELPRLMAWQTLSHMPAGSSDSSNIVFLAMQKIQEYLKKLQQENKISKHISPEMLAIIVFISTMGWFQNDYAPMLKNLIGQKFLSLDNPDDLNLDKNNPTDFKFFTHLYLKNLTQVLLHGVL